MILVYYSDVGNFSEKATMLLNLPVIEVLANCNRMKYRYVKPASLVMKLGLVEGCEVIDYFSILVGS